LRRVVYDQDTFVQANLCARFTPERFSIRLKALQQARESVMGRCLRFVGLHSSRFGRADYARRGNDKVDVVFVSAFRRIHAAFLLYLTSTA